MATNEKVDVVIVGAGASGSVYAAVLARQGKSVVVLEQGPDWQLSDLISSDIWGRRVKPAGGPFILEGKHPVSYGYQAGWAWAVPRCITLPTSRAYCRTISR
jgi:choline dehydrogenase-like flavoprotein